MEKKYEHECNYECRNADNDCPESHEIGYLCTRNKGHEGKHVACGCEHDDHEIKIWERGKNEK